MRREETEVRVSFGRTVTSEFLSPGNRVSYIDNLASAKLSYKLKSKLKHNPNELSI